MNNSINVQNPSFGMAFKIKEPIKFREYAKNLAREDKEKFADDLKYAIDKLGTKDASKTTFTDLTAKFDSEGRIYYEPDIREYSLDEITGEVSRGCLVGDPYEPSVSLREATDKILAEEARMAAEHAQLVEEGAKIKATNEKLGEQLDIICPQ